MIAGIADEEIAGADADSMRILQLSRAGSQAAQAGNGLKAAIAWIKTLELSGLRIEQIQTAISRLHSIAGEDQSAKTSAGFGQQASAAGDDQQAKIVAGDGDVIQRRGLPSHAAVEQP